MPQTTNYEWDEENRLVGVARPDGTSEEYEYSSEGQRRARTVTSGGLSEVTKYVWDVQNVLQETDGTGSVKAHYTDAPGYWGGLTSVRLSGSTPGSQSAQFNASTFGSAGFNQAATSTDTGSFFYHFDQQASTRQLTDASGNVSDAYIYRAFGEEVQSSGSTPNPLRFHGQYGARKDSNNQIDMRARVYDQTTGVWRSPDPIGFSAGDVNLYRFVNNNPIEWYDPEGLWPEIPWPRIPGRDIPWPPIPHRDRPWPPFHWPDNWPKPPRIPRIRIPRPPRLPSPSEIFPSLACSSYSGHGNCCSPLPRNLTPTAIIEAAGKNSCPPGKPGCDCIDLCCQAHDQCLGDVWNFINFKHCQATLEICALGCLAPGGCVKMPCPTSPGCQGKTDADRCRQAAVCVHHYAFVTARLSPI